VIGVEAIKYKLGSYDGVAVDCRGRSGGVALLWEKTTQVSLLSYSLHHIDVIVEGVGSHNSWRFTGIYGWAETSQKIKTCELIKDIHHDADIPWLLGGDLNEILFNFEKKGGAIKNQHVLDAFRETLEECGLYDLGFKGYEFTWENRREGGDVIEERLDRYCASMEWSVMFPDAEVLHLDERLSDHLSLLLKLKPVQVRRGKGRRRFMFENMWVQEDSCRQVVKVTWEVAGSHDPWTRLTCKIEACTEAIGRWKQNTFGEVKLRIGQLAAQLRGEKDIHRRRSLLNEISSWRRKEEVFWAQRAKADFLKYGDSNSRWFHTRAKMRRKNNSISRLKTEEGTWAETAGEVKKIVVDYFANLFTSTSPERMEEVLETIPTRVTEVMNDSLLRPYSDVEIFEALKMMGPTKSPGPDGFNALFFQQYWDIVGRDVLSLVQSILSGGNVHPKLNHTHVVLIPKVKEPTNIAEFRPISLCNVVYKLITKVISNRLKKLLPAIISETQSAFIPGRLITDNVLIAYEIFHSMLNQSHRNRSMAIKIDMSKVYDRVEWPFLRKVMLKLGFKQVWVDMVMACVESATFSFLINGEPQGMVKSYRGLRQGDPISPYLFLLVTEGLIGLLRKAESTGSIQGHLVCRGAPPISHLLFAYDSIFFCKASYEQARVVKKVLRDYEEVFGQQVNFSKSS